MNTKNEITTTNTAEAIKVTKAEYHANKHTGNYFCKPIWYPNLKAFGGYSYYKKA